MEENYTWNSSSLGVFSPWTSCKCCEKERQHYTVVNASLSQIFSICVFHTVPAFSDLGCIYINLHDLFFVDYWLYFRLTFLRSTSEPQTQRWRWRPNIPQNDEDPGLHSVNTDTHTCAYTHMHTHTQQNIRLQTQKQAEITQAWTEFHLFLQRTVSKE